MSTKIILIGSYISEYVENDIFSNYLKDAKTFSISNIVYERKLLKGLQDFDTIFLSCPTIGKYPKSIKREKTFFSNEEKVIYCNYSLRHHLLWNKLNSIKKEIKKIIRGFSLNDEVIVMVMEMHLPFQIAAVYLKKMLKKRKIKTRICSFCPDISSNVIDTTRKHSFVYKWLKRVYSGISINIFKKSDSFVLFTKFMAQSLSLDEKKCFVLPAIQDVSDKQDFFSPKNPYSMLFSGKLQEKNGLRLVLDYFDSPLADDRFELHICGSGEMEKEIEAVSSRNKKIIFHGFLKPNEVKKLQSQCLIVFSLRDPNWFGVPYSFPSKFFEALSLGNNVITRKLITYDSEVDDFVYYLDNLSIEGLDSSIRKALSFELDRKAKQYEYLANFGTKKVGSRIVSFILNT